MGFTAEKNSNDAILYCAFLSCHIRVYSKSTHWGCLNVKELFARNRRDILGLSDWNGTQTHNHLVRKRKLNHSAKLVIIAKWLSVRLQTQCLHVRVPLQSRITTFDAIFIVPYTPYKFQKTWKNNIIDRKKYLEQLSNKRITSLTRRDNNLIICINHQINNPCQ